MSDKTPDSTPSQRHRNRHRTSHKRGGKVCLREQTEAELSREDRILDNAECIYRQQQKEHRRNLCDNRQFIVPRHHWRNSDQHSVEYHRDRNVERKYRAIILLRRFLLANQRLRKSAVDHHQSQSRKEGQNRHHAEILGHKQTGNNDAHNHLQQHRADLLGDAPRNASGNLILQHLLAHRFAESELFFKSLDTQTIRVETKTHNRAAAYGRQHRNVAELLTRKD